MNFDDLLASIISVEQKLQSAQDYLKIRNHQEVVRTVPISARIAAAESALDNVRIIVEKLTDVADYGVAPESFTVGTSYATLRSPNKWLRFSHGMTVNIDKIDSLCCTDAPTLRATFPYLTLGEGDGIWFAVIATKLNIIILNERGSRREVAEYIVKEVSAVLGNVYNNSDVESFDLILDIERMIESAEHLSEGSTS